MCYKNQNPDLHHRCLPLLATDQTISILKQQVTQLQWRINLDKNYLNKQTNTKANYHFLKYENKLYTAD